MAIMTTTALSNSASISYTTYTDATTSAGWEYNSTSAYGSNYVYTIPYVPQPVISDKYMCAYCGCVMKRDAILENGRCIHCGGPYEDED